MSWRKGKFANGNESLAFGSITGPGGVGVSMNSAALNDVAILIIGNTLNQDVELSFNNGTTWSHYLQPSTGMTLELGANDLDISFASGHIKVRYPGTAPASGRISYGVVNRGS